MQKACAVAKGARLDRIDARQFWEEECGPLARPNTAGWQKPQRKYQPPCHHSQSGRSFVVHCAGKGKWHCFGCGASGDVPAFVQLRDHCSFVEAAKLLGCWSDMTSEECLKLDREAARRQQEREQAAQTRELARQQRIALRGEIHTLISIQSEVSARLDELLRGSPEAHAGETEHCWCVLAIAFDDLRQVDTAYCSLAGLGCA